MENIENRIWSAIKKQLVCVCAPKPILNKDAVVSWQSYSVGDGQWSLEGKTSYGFSEWDQSCVEFVGSNGTRDGEEPDDLWARIGPWEKDPKGGLAVHHWGTCLAVFVVETKEKYWLYSFILDKKHGLNIIKSTTHGTLLGRWKEDIIRAELNMFYKESYDLLELFMMSHYTVKCYIKEPKKRKK